MKKNMGNADRFIRMVVALVIAGLWFTDVITGTWAYIALALAFIFLVTSFAGFCPLYTLFKINSGRKETT
jgi:fatty acid desaturase